MRWGATPQRPLKKAYEQSPQAVSKWVNEEYPKITQRARQEGAEIQWAKKPVCVPMTSVTVATRRRDRLRLFTPMPIANMVDLMYACTAAFMQQRP
jgi:hypothetical protein